MAHTVVKVRKISAGKKNVEYLEDKDKHPDICLSYSTCDKDLWNDYFKVNREAFEKSGQVDQNGKAVRCVEAREFILVFPNEFYDMPERSRGDLLKVIADGFKKKYGIEIYAAMHGSDDDHKNLHIHCMYMERHQVVEQDKIAKRNMYFDPEGKQVRAKKDAVDPETKELLPGYTMVPKGECYGKKSWTAKNKWLHSREFTHELKETFTVFLNKCKRKYIWAQNMEEREVYNRAESPYLPLQGDFKPLTYRNPSDKTETAKIETEASKDIKECNALRNEYNHQVRELIWQGEPVKDLVERRKEVSREIQIAMENNQQHWVADILRKAVEKIKEYLKELLAPEKQEEFAFQPRFSPLDFKISDIQKEIDKHSHKESHRKSRSDWDLDR